MNQNLTMDRYKISLRAGQVVLVVKFETFFSKLTDQKFSLGNRGKRASISKSSYIPPSENTLLKIRVYKSQKLYLYLC